MHKLTLLSLLSLLSISSFAFHNSPYSSPNTVAQVINFNDVPYDGQRLYIGPATADSKHSKLLFTISNTGREEVRLGGDYSNIVINVDPTFNAIGSADEVKKIVLEMLSKKKMIQAGQVLTGQEMDLGFMSKNMASNSKKDKPAASKSNKAKEKTNEKTESDNGTVVIETATKEKDKDRGKFLDPDDCPDLVIKDIEVIKENKYMIAIEYTVKNQGTGTASLHGPKNTVDDNMFLKAYISATPKFTRSAKTIGESAVKKEMDNKDGTLPQNREFKGKMYMNIRGRTNLTPYLILTLDPYQTVRECNERNNRSYIKIEETKK